ncbi:hypothetical protein DXG03_001995 [Asterophora parasitica]|uniref:Peptidase A1 domain-containing protein n=1 Tax=Asterophora parasitica TaxID=117018 RepID=A0A9P7KEY2_9AGAR|nr:hypothetical protein DXG03_001995 [Asterophora parasitica]
MRVGCMHAGIALASAFLLSLLSPVAAAPEIEIPRHEVRTEHGIHLPIHKRKASNSLRRRGSSGAIGLGNFVDVTYNVLVTVGGVSTPVVLDTGSSDLWVISDACKTCSTEVQLYPQATFQSIGLEARLLYGDSRTGTHAFGLIGKDTVDLAGLTLQNQFFAAINDTNTSVEDTGSAGIFGLGFPVNSVIWTTIFIDEAKTGNTKRELSDNQYNRPDFPELSKLWNTVADHFTRFGFPNVGELYGGNSKEKRQSQTTAPFSARVAESYTRTGPLLGRLVATDALTLPQFTITLQRDTVDIGGNVGLLSIGELPKGIQNESLTWVPLRTYNVDQGGLPPPPDSPVEEYPITWEVFIDDVYLDGVKLPRSTLSSPSIALSALVDTGNSLLRGPADIVAGIRSKLGARFPCNEPHTLSFQIGGKLFPVDPRDFVNQEFVNSVNLCSANLVATDPPAEGRYLYSWSLGDPFLKSVLATYHYGNLTYPSRDQPRMGFLSTVPEDADDQLKAAVAAASKNGGNFPMVSEPAPTGAPTGTIHTVPAAKPTNKGNPAMRAQTAWGAWAASLLALIGAAVAL